MTKLTDYAIVLLTYFARQPDRPMVTAGELSAEARLPLPTVIKLLKMMTRGGLLVSHRGVKGGYTLARQPEMISVVDIINALEGPIAITQCSGHTPGICEHEGLCPTRTHWQLINRAVQGALENITLREMIRPLSLELVSSGRLQTQTASLSER